MNFRFLRNNKAAFFISALSLRDPQATALSTKLFIRVFQRFWATHPYCEPVFHLNPTLCRITFCTWPARKDKAKQKIYHIERCFIAQNW